MTIVNSLARADGVYSPEVQWCGVTQPNIALFFGALLKKGRFIFEGLNSGLASPC